VSVERVFVARHGQTEWNRTRRRQGQLDSPLTATGVGQAERVAAALDRLGIDAVLSSPLGRAAETARIAGERLGLPVVTVDELAEIDHGDFTGLTDAEIDARYPGQLAGRATAKYTWRFPNGESYADAYQRADRALAIVLDGSGAQPVLITHEMIGRMLRARLLGLDPREALNLDHPHDVIYQIAPGDGVSETALECPPEH
jgi:broad specificity phosphatase PhoE